MRAAPHRMLIVALVFGLLAGTQAFATQAEAKPSGWIVSAEKAKSRIESGEATVLDTRGESEWKSGHVPGAVAVNWQDFSRGESPHGGKLLDDAEALSAKLRKLGVSNQKPVLVVGKPPHNWGEDGRIVWMLRALGHRGAALVDGGHAALVAAGLEEVTKTRQAEPGDFEAAESRKYSMDREQLKKAHTSEKFVVVDTREAVEFQGKTPYGESRGGHVPGAKHLHYTDLMRTDGRLLPKPEIEKKLEKLGISPDKKIVAYCTGGVRSAWLVAVLAHLGYADAMNYAGSMWDWSAQPADEFPLSSP